MTYGVKDIFLTIQGEGSFAGQVAIFCRFLGCNLWSGLERDRSSAQCQFCDTDFIKPSTPSGGTFFRASQLADHIISFWPKLIEGDRKQKPFVVFTGGEPLLQLDGPLIKEMHKRDAFIAVESNGTIKAPRGIDWLCISPKAGCALKQISGDELKLVFPQEGITPQSLEHLNFKRFSLQPMDVGPKKNYTDMTIDYCCRHPQWTLSLQTHKLIGIP